MRIGRIAIVVCAITTLGPAQAQRADCTDAGSTVEISRCFERELAREDAALNRVFQQATRSIRENDAMADGDRRNWEAALRDAQRKWIAFRDADCKDTVGYEWFGGTGAGSAVLACMAQKTRTRTKELTERYVNR